MLGAFLDALLGRRKRAEFVGYNQTASASGAVTWPAGTQAGDIAIIHSTYCTPSSWGSGWNHTTENWLGYGYQSQTSWKVLTAGDISTPPSPMSSDVRTVSVYRGGTTVTQRSTYGDTAGATSTTAPIPSFSPAAASRGVVSFCDDRSATTTSFVVPADGIKRGGAASGLFSCMYGDCLNYTGQTGITWGTTATGTARWAVAYEIT